MKEVLGAKWLKRDGGNSSAKSKTTIPAQGAKNGPGPRFTKPKPRVRDARDPHLYDPRVISEIRQELTGHRLQLDGHQLSPMPSDLAQLAYQCDAPKVTGYAGMPAFMNFAYGLGLADLLGDLAMRKRESTYAPGKLSELVVAILAAGLERV